MPFDSVMPETFNSLVDRAKHLPVGRERLAILADILEHPDFRVRWARWDYAHTDTCALAVCDQIWGTTPRNYPELYGMTLETQHAVFYGINPGIMEKVTPRQVAKALHEFLMV